MHTLENYSNRDLDANIMLKRLKSHRNVTTEQALASIDKLKESRTLAIRNYKDTREIDNALGSLQLLVSDRERWSDYCFDDCSHWAGTLN